MTNVQELKLYYLHGKHVLRVASHRGEELFLRLASHGIESRVARVNGHAQLEMDDDVNLDVVRALLYQWC